MKRFKKFFSAVLIFLMAYMLIACGRSQVIDTTKTAVNYSSSLKTLPLPEADNSDFGIDKNINQNTIDEWLGRDDVEYIDVRMLFDPANFSEIGGEADLTSTIKGFKVVPYPYLGTLQSLPVSNAYAGKKLFEVKWAENGQVISAEPLYRESMMIMEETFPKNKNIFLMCGGGGYANMTKQLLINLGWDKNKLYNVGANWTYEGKNKLELIVYPEKAGEKLIYATWRANYVNIDFDKLLELK